MSELQKKAVDRIYTLPDEDIDFLLQVMERLMPEEKEPEESKPNTFRGFGLAKDEDLYAEDFDLIYGGNDEIAEMFGVNE